MAGAGPPEDGRQFDMNERQKLGTGEGGLNDHFWVLAATKLPGS